MTAADGPSIPPASPPVPSGLDVGGGGRLPLIVYLLLAGLCLVVMLPGFFTTPPFDRDEARFAQASHQMLVSQDFVDIRFQDEFRYKKPIGIYWMQAAATALTADAPHADGPLSNEIWTFRLPSLIGAIVAVVATAWGGTRLFGPAVGVAAGIMMASSVLLGVEARMAKTDAVLLACTALAQFALAFHYVERKERHGLPLAAVLWGAIAVGVLVKGPIIVMVCGTTVAFLAVWDRSAAWLSTVRWRLGLVVVALAVLPWLIAITLKTGGQFFAESVGHDMLAKVASGQEGKGLPAGFYAVTFLVTFQPWATLALLALPWVWRHRQDPAVRFAIAWSVPTWLIFEAVPTKLLHYTLPVFPAVAVLTARALFDPDRAAAFIRQHKRTALAACALGGIAFIAVLAGVAALPWVLDHRIDALSAVILAIAVVPFWLALRAVWSDRPGRAVAATLGAAVLLHGVAFGRVLPGLEAPWPSRWIAAEFARLRPCPTSVLASAGFSEPSLVFLAGTSTRLVHGADAARHLQNDPACAVAVVEEREEAEFRATLGDAEPVRLTQTQAINYNNGRKLHLSVYRLLP